jgi:hypothetical protein
LKRTFSSREDSAVLKFLVHTLLLCAVLIFPIVLVARGVYQPDAAWYQAQKMNPQAQARLGIFHSFCRDAGDPVRTRFRMAADRAKSGTETYQYWKNGQWKPIPADIVQRKPTPDGQPVLFVSRNDGRELCFIFGREGLPVSD